MAKKKPSDPNTETKETPTWYLPFFEFWQKNYGIAIKWVSDWHSWVYYNDQIGIYQEIIEDRINEIIYNYFDSVKLIRSIAKLKLAISSIQANQKWCALLKDFDADHNIRNVENGLLHVDTKIVTPHTPKYLSLRQMGVIFDITYTDRPTPCWDDLWQKFPMAMSYVEWFNRAVIYNNMNDRQALFLAGPQGAGKGTVLNLMDVWYAKESSHVSIEMMGESFGLYPMVGKQINLDKEGTLCRLPPLCIKYFKSITGRDGFLSVNGKNKPQFDHFFNPFFFAGAYNQLPGLPTTDLNAFFDRTLIAEFNIKSMQDPTFKDRLLLEKNIIFTQLVLIGYTPFFGKQILVEERGIAKLLPHHDFWIANNKNVWDKWSNPVRIVVEMLFERDVGTQRMPIDQAMELVQIKLTELQYPCPKDHALKAQITNSLKRFHIAKLHTGSLTYYAPIRLKNPQHNTEFLEENPEMICDMDYTEEKVTKHTGIDAFF